MDTQKSDLIKRISESTNVLVTVSSNPSLDQLSAAIGLTLVLNKVGKHATAVFSGKVPDTIEFLKPDETLEKNTDSLRDFIIALDKSKADKLRYKVEDKHVKIFITPYRTSLSESDLEFSQGDFNVDVIVALGVREQQDLDEAITAHGRILHDATITSVNREGGSALGTIKWEDPNVSSISEMMVDLSENLAKDVIDAQIATAFLTGIVSETARFSNEKTTSATMNISARLMGAGANQQLIAAKIDEKKHEEPGGDFDPLVINELAHDEPVKEEKPAQPDLLQIDHAEFEAVATEEPPVEEEEKEVDHQIHIDGHGTIRPAVEAAAAEEAHAVSPIAEGANAARRILEPPTLGGTLTGSTNTGDNEPFVNPLSPPAEEQPLLSHDSGPAQPVDTPAVTTMPDPDNSVLPAPAAPDLNAILGSAEPDSTPPEPVQTLAALEESVQSPHVDTPPAPVEEVKPDETNIDAARDAVLSAINAAPSTTPEPIQALNAMPVDLTPAPDTTMPPELTPYTPEPTADSTSPQPIVVDPTAPPPVPPPMMPPLPGMNNLPSVQDSPDQDQPPAPNPFNLPPTN